VREVFDWKSLVERVDRSYERAKSSMQPRR
jgi:hypothetical protein